MTQNITTTTFPTSGVIQQPDQAHFWSDPCPCFCSIPTARVITVGIFQGWSNWESDLKLSTSVMTTHSCFSRKLIVRLTTLSSILECAQGFISGVVAWIQIVQLNMPLSSPSSPPAACLGCFHSPQIVFPFIYSLRNVRKPPTELDACKANFFYRYSDKAVKHTAINKC